MSDFKSRDLFQAITDGLKGMDEKEKKDVMKKVSELELPRRRSLAGGCPCPSPFSISPSTSI